LKNLVPLLASERLGMSQGTIGVMFTLVAAGNVGILGHAGRALDRAPRPVVGRSLAATWIGTAATGQSRSATPLLAAVVTRSLAVTGVVTAAIGYAGSSTLLLIGVVVLGMATGYAAVSPMVLAADIATPQTQGRAVGVLRSATDSALMLGPVAAGALSDVVGL